PAFYKISGNTRNCIAILHEGNQTEILEQGPTISHEEAEGFLDHYSNLIKQSEVVTISGSLPSRLPNDYYEKLIQLASDEGVAVVLDCSGAPLETVLK
ncbi:PfkB family carbohydrate kinase, partial [Enterococcus faecalis]